MIFNVLRPFTFLSNPCRKIREGERLEQRHHWCVERGAKWKQSMRELNCGYRVVIRRRKTGREAQALQETKAFRLNEQSVFQLSLLRVNIGFLVQELYFVANNCQLKSNSTTPLLNE